jgi:hypothetical protein
MMGDKTTHLVSIFYYTWVEHVTFSDVVMGLIPTEGATIVENKQRMVRGVSSDVVK